MVANVNAELNLCGTSIHIYSISTNSNHVNKEKTYYQHRHPSFEIHYVRSGKYKVTCCNNSQILSETSMILIPPGIYHDVTPTEQNSIRICISFSMQNMLNSAKNAFYDAYAGTSPAFTVLNGCEAQQMLLRIEQLIDDVTPDNFKNDKLLALCGSLLLEIIPYIDNCKSGIQFPQAKQEHEDINFKIDSFLGTHFMCNNAKSRIASDLYISPRQLQRIIQKNYGMSYRQKLAETRLQIAIDLLCNSNTPIHKISEILGYSCSANFSAFIKRSTGKTPSQIRKAQ